jgi:hypothetical protein
MGAGEDKTLLRATADRFSSSVGHLAKVKLAEEIVRLFAKVRMQWYRFCGTTAIYLKPNIPNRTPYYFLKPKAEPDLELQSHDHIQGFLYSWLKAHHWRVLVFLHLLDYLFLSSPVLFPLF